MKYSVLTRTPSPLTVVVIFKVANIRKTIANAGARATNATAPSPVGAMVK